MEIFPQLESVQFKYLQMTKSKIDIAKIFFLKEVKKKIVWTGKKWEFPAFPPFPTMFSKALFKRIVWNRDCLVKNELVTTTSWNIVAANNFLNNVL